MNNWQVALLVLASLFAGLAIPLLVQLFSTLRAAQLFLRDTGPRLDRALDEVRETTGRLNRMTAEIERSGALKESLDGVRELSTSVAKFANGLRKAGALGAAIAPAVLAAIEAFRSPDGGVDAEELAELERQMAEAGFATDGDPNGTRDSQTGGMT